MKSCARLLLLLPILSACAGREEEFYRSQVSADLASRSGHGIRVEPETDAAGGSASLPAVVDAADGLDQDEAIAVALWRNATFQEALTALGVARADLIQAGLLANPTLSVLFPLGPKQLEFTATLPLDVLFFRHRRVAVAELDIDQIEANLVAGGLDLARGVALAYAELRLATRRNVLAADRARVRAEIAALQESRLAAGDVSELEASSARTAGAAARQDALRCERQVGIVEERIRELIGWEDELGPASFVTVEEADASRVIDDQDARALVHAALAWRPELRAAELVIEAAGGRAGLARWDVLQVAAGIDANEVGKSGFEMGPSLGIELPIFDWNQGKRARARAEVERAAHHYRAERRRIIHEVEEARARLDLAAESLSAWREDVLVALETELSLSRGASAAGATSPLPALQLEDLGLDSRVREAELAGELDRARADLERAVGGRYLLAAAIAHGTAAR